MATVFDRFDIPACARTLGWKLLEADPERGSVTISFRAGKSMINPAGTVQGGFLAAMLDDTMGPAIVVKSDAKLYSTTINLIVSFIAPARVGRFYGRGQVVNMGKTIAHLRGELYDADDRLVATATASARLIPMQRIAST